MPHWRTWAFRQTALERSPDARTAFVQVPVPNTAPTTFKRVDNALAPARAAGMTASVGGELGLANSNPSTSASERLGFIAVLIVLLVAFGSGVAAGVPIVTAVLSLVVGLSALTLIGRVAPIPGSANALAGMIGLGVAVDYALFVLTRFRAELAKGRHPHDAVALSLAAAGQAVIFAGGAVVVAICGLALTGIGFIVALGLSAALVVAISVAAALTLLPAVLAVLGPRVNAWRLPWARRTRTRGRQRPVAALGTTRHPAPGSVPAGERRATGGADGAPRGVAVRRYRCVHARARRTGPSRLRERWPRASVPASTGRSMWW